MLLVCSAVVLQRGFSSRWQNITHSLFCLKVYFSNLETSYFTIALLNIYIKANHCYFTVITAIDPNFIKRILTFFQSWAPSFPDFPTLSCVLSWLYKQMSYNRSVFTVVLTTKSLVSIRNSQVRRASEKRRVWRVSSTRLRSRWGNWWSRLCSWSWSE